MIEGFRTYWVLPDCISQLPVKTCIYLFTYISESLKVFQKERQVEHGYWGHRTWSAIHSVERWRGGFSTALGVGSRWFVWDFDAWALVLHGAQACSHVCGDACLLSLPIKLAQIALYIDSVCFHNFIVVIVFGKD